MRIKLTSPTSSLACFVRSLLKLVARLVQPASVQLVVSSTDRGTLVNMGGGNAQKSATKRARNLEKLAPSKGSQLKANAAAMTLKCHVCLTQFVCTSKEQQLKDHQENRHPKSTFEQCFPDFQKA